MRRMAWLDALRGYAALTVVLFHLSPQMIGVDRHLAIYRQIDVGKYGVLLFFLVSGYVIPMSLERHGSLRRFWIGRLLRIYPAYLVTIALVTLLVTAGLMRWQGSLRAETVTGVLAHASMTPDLAGLRGVVRVFWTLSYEMVFYLIVTGLYAWRLHRLSAWWAAGLAIVSLLAGPYLPDDLFGDTFARRRVLAGVLLIVVALVVLACLKRRFVKLAGVLGLAVVFVPALNGHPTADSTVTSSRQALTFLAVMFAGTVVYRWQHGQIGRFAGLTALTMVTLGLLGSQRTYATTAALAVTFLFAYAMRNRAMPLVLPWLGRISYSLYLLHVVLLFLTLRIVPELGTQPVLVRLLAGVTYLIGAIGLAWLSYRMVELPAQRLVRKIAGPGPARPITATERALPGTARGENERQSV
ncbi:acyltransferase [Actinoplanes sp. NPDC048796]|uniref:acyltransferase family protein n=1 Tax=unclassified Actinoplanes TaxID=2626549 RepID=UPI0033E6268D